jgi:hypothetical protein
VSYVLSRLRTILAEHKVFGLVLPAPPVKREASRDILASMSHRASFAVFSLATLPLSAQTPVACSGQLIPLRPAGMTCQQAAPVCVTDPSGTRGHWAWGCPNASGNQAVQVTPQAPLPQLQYPHINTPDEVRMKAEQLRNQQLQNQQLQNQISTPAAPSQPVVVPVSPTASDLSEIMTMDHPNGRLWKSWTDTGKLAYLLGMREALNPLMEGIPKHEASTYFSPKLTLSQTQAGVDGFYEDPQNVRIPIFAALRLVTMKANGAPKEEVDSQLAINRKISGTPTEVRAGESATPVAAFKAPEPFPANWKSMTSGNRYTIRNEPDVVYVERVLSDAEKQIGNFTSLELHRDTTGYKGSERIIAVGSYLDRWKTQQIFNRCTFDYPVEVSVYTQTRIEFRVSAPPNSSKLDFKTCAFDNKTRTWQSFVWIPE